MISVSMTFVAQPPAESLRHESHPGHWLSDYDANLPPQREFEEGCALKPNLKVEPVAASFGWVRQSVPLLCERQMATQAIGGEQHDDAVIL